MSRAGDELAYVLRCGIYAARSLLCIVYGVFQFIGKPGSRVIVPTLLAGAAYYERAPLLAFISNILPHLQWSSVPVWLTPGRAAFAGVVLAACIGVTFAPVLFHIRWALSFVTGLFGFIVRLVVLVLFAGIGLALFYNLPLDTRLLRYLPFGIGQQLLTFDWHSIGKLDAPTTPIAVLACGVALATCVYVALSRLMALMLGAFPPPVRPLPPLRKLRTRTRAIESVAVRIVVPKPPRRMRVIPTDQLPV